MHSGTVKYGDYHMFQKPPELMEFLIRHHSFTGDLVVNYHTVIVVVSFGGFKIDEESFQVLNSTDTEPDGNNYYEDILGINRNLPEP